MFYFFVCLWTSTHFNFHSVFFGTPILLHLDFINGWHHFEGTTRSFFLLLLLRNFDKSSVLKNKCCGNSSSAFIFNNFGKTPATWLKNCYFMSTFQRFLKFIFSITSWKFIFYLFTLWFLPSKKENTCVRKHEIVSFG